MELGDFKNLGKNILENDTFNNIVTSFIKELSDFLEKSKKNCTTENNILNIEEGEINFIGYISNEKVELLNPDTGEQKNVYIAISEETKQKLNAKGITSDIYEMDKMDFYDLSIGDKVIMNNGKFKEYSEEIEIKDDKIWFVINDIKSALAKCENLDFTVEKITDEKIYLSLNGDKDYVEIYRELYPDFEIGDVVTRIDGKYIKSGNLEN